MSQAEPQEEPLAPDEEALLLEALACALRPKEIDASLNDRLIEAALASDDPFAPASVEELRESARLREALEQGTPHADVDALRALQLAFKPDDASAELLARALSGDAKPAGPAPTEPPPLRSKTTVIYAAFGGSGVVLAFAAMFALLVGTPESPAPVTALVKPHSTLSLFSEPFETADTTARIDRIASARGRELRDNRYAAWGVK